MGNKGHIKTQYQYEQETLALKLIEEGYHRKELSATETILQLRQIGFSESMATNKINHWDTMEPIDLLPETMKAQKNRQIKQTGLVQHIFKRGSRKNKKN